MVIIAGPRDRREREFAACNSTTAPVSIYRRPDSGHRREIARCNFTQELHVTGEADVVEVDGELGGIQGPALAEVLVGGHDVEPGFQLGHGHDLPVAS